MWEYLPKGLESYPSLQGQEVDSLREGCSDSEPSATLNSTPTALTSLKQGLQMAICAMRRYGVILRPSTGVPGLDRWILSLPASPALHFPSPESRKERMTHATCGRTPFASLEKSDLDGFFWKMSQLCLPGLMDISDEYCVTFSRAGMMLDGTAYPLPPLAPRTVGTGSGFSHPWSTPIQSDASGNMQSAKALEKGFKPRLTTQAKHWRTPSASDGEGGIMEMQEGKSGHYKLRDHVQEKNRHMWPTPAAQEPGWKNIEVVDKDGNPPEHPAQRFFHKETGRLVQKGLEQMAAMFPTPSTVDGGSYFNKSQSAGASNRPTLGAMARFNLWPTPSASKTTPNSKDPEDIVNSDGEPISPGEKPHDRRTGKPVQTALADAVRWPTPPTRDHKDSGDAVAIGKIPVNGLLGRAVYWPTPHAGTREGQTAGGHAGLASSAHMRNKLKDMAGEEGKKMATQALNPDWVEWLMNWPIGWTDLEPLGDISAWEQNVQSIWDYDPADYGFIPRITTQRKNRVKRLKAIGNGQVPLCAAVAFLLLQGEYQ